MPYPDSGVRCPIAACPRDRRPFELMCGYHWSRVPGRLARELVTAFKERVKASKRWGSPLYRDAVVRHERAKRAAIEAVEATTGGAADADS